MSTIENARPQHKFSVESVGRTGMTAHVSCGKCGLHGEFTRFGRWANVPFLRKSAIAWLKSHECTPRVAA
jgi:hypothetical protein